MAKKKASSKTGSVTSAKQQAATPRKKQPSTVIEISLEAEAAEIVTEIVGIAQRIDDAGLQTLLNAARAVDMKGKIEKFNRELNVVAEKASRRRRELNAPEYRVRIERTEDDFFVIQLDTARVFFNRQEMREITRRCHAAKDAPDAARRMYRWFEKERSDLLTDAGINSERNPYLIDLYEQVISTYKVKTAPTR